VTDGTGRFLYRFARPAPDLEHERELTFHVDGEQRSATLYTPSRAGHDDPAWILLQGVTVPGRHHEGVRRMARSLAAAGHLAVVPEVPTWTALRVDPRQAEPTVRAALALLGDWPRVDRARVGLMGFSVAATWGLEVAAGRLGPELRAVVGMGGYGDFRRMLRAMVTGEHEWQGRHYQQAPDPYGRWILGADLLPAVADETYGAKQEREAAARALHRLACTAGRNGAPAQAPVYDPLIGQLRETVPVGALGAWDLLAPDSRQGIPDRRQGCALADALAEAGLKAYPELDPTGRLKELTVPTILLHGRSDALIPFTETLRLASELPPAVRRAVTITRLVGHAKTAQARPPRSPLALARELRQFAWTVGRILGSLEG
jgi:dienelactone hydrolase